LRDWIGVYLDTIGQGSECWGEIADIIQDAYRVSAAKKFVAQLDSGPT
jgi:hypothetical protein